MQEKLASSLEEKNSQFDTLQASLAALEKEHYALKVTDGC